VQSNQSPSAAIKDLEGQIRRVLRTTDEAKLTKKPRGFISDLRQVIIDAKIYATDYELSEMREEQLNNAKQARHYLEKARVDILGASEDGIFSAIDVAHLSAQIGQIIDKLQ
jgi:hypothetical protein